MEKFDRNVGTLIGNTPLLRLSSLSDLTSCDIFLKCENLNPGGSVKDRAALGMVQDALSTGALKPGMTIVEGTAGNTGIGLALVGRSFGFDSLIVMPNNQSPQKVAALDMYGAAIKLVKPCPFADQNHFYHTAKAIAESSRKQYWWANQFENLANYQQHYLTTGPEIWRQTSEAIDYLVSVAGTGGTIAGTSRFLKEQNSDLKVILCDPEGSGLREYFKSGKFVAEGNSFSEGIGIMRLVANMKEAKVDRAVTVADRDGVTVAYYLRKMDGIVLGTSAALNVAACLKMALQAGPGKRLVTFWCDQPERSATKLWNQEFLGSQGISVDDLDIEDLCQRYRDG